MENQLQVIFGTGPLGRSIMEELVARGKRVRMVNRSGRADVPKGVDVVKADLLKGVGVDEAAAGASVIYQCSNPPYDKWPELFPSLQKSILNVAMRVNAKVVIGENLYMYGDTDGAPLTEDLPYLAKTRKGTVRAQMAIDALQMHRDGNVRVVIGRASDYFGPGVLASAMGERVFIPALKGKAASLLGNIDLPHTFSYIGDVGKALVTLGEHDDAFGEAWHLPSPPAISQRAMAEMIFSQLGKEPKTQAAGRWMMTFAGLFVPAAKEIVEMMYEFEKPFIMNSSKFERRFGIPATKTEDAVRNTIEWYRYHISHGK
jgi:nucleoside-diphosphate-sugar epimerase